MANFDGYTPQSVPRFGSVVQWDDETQLPIGLARTARNVRYRAQSVLSRNAVKNRLKFGTGTSPIGGLGVLRYLSTDNTGTEIIELLAFTRDDGNIWAATPFVQGSVTKLTTDAFMALANQPRFINASPQISQAFNRGYVAMGDNQTGAGFNYVYDPGTGFLDPLSDKPVGAAWQPKTRYRVGQMISPATLDVSGPVPTWIPKKTGNLFRCTTAGLSAATQPVWPTTTGGTIADGTVNWKETTPTCAAGLPTPPTPAVSSLTVDGASPIVNNATVFLVCTWTNSLGEGTADIVKADGTLNTAAVLQYKNVSGGPVDLNVLLPSIPTALLTSGPLGPTMGVTGCNLYAYIVPGTPDPTKFLDPGYYALVAASTAGATVVVSTFPAGAAIPSVNTAYVAGAGNVSVGVRYMVVFFETRTEYQTGFTVSAPIRVEVNAAGRALRSDVIPIGPYNTKRRLCAFTVAGQSAAGPYRYIDKADVESPGLNQADIPITATVIEDNTTTTANFDFTDTYLVGAFEVTDYFNRTEVPPASDIYFSKTLQRVIYTGCPGFPSGHLVCDAQDPEAIRIPGSNLQVSESDGDRSVCWREVRESQISLKENSGHAVLPNDGDPSTWGADELWRGKGPTGAKAVDVYSSDQTAFMIFAHKTGLFKYTSGAPDLISREVEAIWKGINWDAGAQIRVVIDGLRQVVHIYVPYGASTVNNKRLTLNYYFGWSDPIVFVVRSGKLVPNVEGRKWSFDDISANDAQYIPKRKYSAAGNYQTLVPTTAPSVVLANNPTPGLLNGATLEEMTIIGGADGALYTENDGVFHDEDFNGNPVGYFSQWAGVATGNPGLKIMQCGGATVSAKGNGLLNVTAVDDQGTVFPLTKDKRQMMLSTSETIRDLIAQFSFTRLGIALDNGGVPDAWWEVHTATLYVRPLWTARKS